MMPPSEVWCTQAPFTQVLRRVILRSWAGSEGLTLWRVASPPYHGSIRGAEDDILSQMRQARHPNSARDARPGVPPGSSTGEHRLPARWSYGIRGILRVVVPLLRARMARGRI